MSIVAKRGPSGLQIDYLPLAGLHPDPGNPRRHSDRQLKQLERSIAAFGFVTPILIDRSNQIIAGHARAQAARRRGLTEVPVVRLEHLSQAQARALAVADNRLCEISTWDDRLLGQLFSDLAALELGFDLEVTGFSMAEIDLRIEGLPDAAEKPDPADQLPDLPNHTPISRPGDVWQLRHHRISCANALEASSYQGLMQGALAQAVFTDPPYNVPINGHVSSRGAARHREFAMAAGEMTDGQFTDFLASALHLLARHSTSGSLHYICIDWRHQLALLTAGSQAYAELLNLCVWVKHNAGIGSLYRSQHELVHVFRNGAGPHRNNVQLGRYGRNRTNVWSYAGASGFAGKSEDGALAALHPTVKPIGLIADALLDCSARGEVVLDSFLGSGSTLLAAERVGRVCYGIELDPLYVDVAIRRWQRLTGETAIEAATGASFDDVAAPHGGYAGGGGEQ